MGRLRGPAAEPDVELLRQSKSLNLDDENEDDAAEACMVNEQAPQQS